MLNDALPPKPGMHTWAEPWKGSGRQLISSFITES